MSSGTVRLSGLEVVPVGEAVTFRFQRSTREEEGFALRLAGGWVAFVNRCPHWSVDLDYGNGRFYDAADHRIYCTTHGALFVPETGYCDAGPCAGASLEALPIEVEGDEGVVTLPVLTILPP